MGLINEEEENFRLETLWLNEKDYHGILESSWEKMQALSYNKVERKIKACPKALSLWHKELIGNVQHKIVNAICFSNELHRKLEVEYLGESVQQKNQCGLSGPK